MLFYKIMLIVFHGISIVFPLFLHQLILLFSSIFNLLQHITIQQYVHLLFFPFHYIYIIMIYYDLSLPKLAVSVEYLISCPCQLSNLQYLQEIFFNNILSLIHCHLAYPMLLRIKIKIYHIYYSL